MKPILFLLAFACLNTYADVTICSESGTRKQVSVDGVGSNTNNANEFQECYISIATKEVSVDETGKYKRFEIFNLMSVSINPKSRVCVYAAANPDHKYHYINCVRTAE